MKKGFTIIEVLILLFVFLIVALLIIPFTLDDTIQAKNNAKWLAQQNDFSNIFYQIRVTKPKGIEALRYMFDKVVRENVNGKVSNYKIRLMNGSNPSETYQFSEFYTINANAVISYKFFDEPKDDIVGIMMYDVNGASWPNRWGKDIFGYNIYNDRMEPFCKQDTISQQQLDCSKSGSGLCCSNYYLLGGDFDR